ncbi:MAG TPA: protein kinase, partial [Chloroflexota bacterium]|nr:protein kinase [Chloroflexota bacterium]
MDATNVVPSLDQAVHDVLAHDQPYSFGRRPTTEAPFPFTQRQFARLLIMRGRHSAASTRSLLPERASPSTEASQATTAKDAHRIPGYELLQLIGHGGMAVVYKARQASTGRTVAIKILSENLAASGEFMERFRREARTASTLCHPNVITAYDFGEDERGVPYLVFEYIGGPTLADVMDKGLDDQPIPDLLD